MEKIAYTLVTTGHGVDGRDFTDKGGKTIGAYWSKEKAIADRNSPWCRIVPVLVDVESSRSHAMSKLTSLDKLVLFGEVSK